MYKIIIDDDIAETLRTDVYILRKELHNKLGLEGEKFKKLREETKLQIGDDILKFRSRDQAKEFLEEAKKLAKEKYV